MKPTTEELLDEVRQRTENTRAAKSLAEALMANLNGVADYHESIGGLPAMRERHFRLMAEAPEEYEALRTEYSDAAYESMQALAQLHELIEGVSRGLDRGLKERFSYNN
jgi:hypothetical protein